MNDLDLELLREWSARPVAPSEEVRAHARARLAQACGAVPLTPARHAHATRRFGKRVAIAALVAAVLVAGALVWVQRQVDDRVARIKTVAVPNGALGHGEVGHGPVNILLVGSDRRDGTHVATFGSPAQTGPPRSDTIILLRIDGTKVRALWIPRDLLIGPAPGVLINSTFNHGAEGLIDAIKSEFGIAIDHYAEVDFRGFPKIVDAMGGVALFSPGHVRDRLTGLELTGPGCRTLDGNTALAWVRSRHLQIEQDGVWTDASPRADLDRQARQQQFIRALARRAKAEAGDDPSAAVRLADAVIPALTLDQGFSRAEILGLVRTLAHVDPATLQLGTLPVRPAPDGAHVVLAPPDAGAALAPFKGESAPPAAPGAGPSIVPSSSPTPDC